MYYNLVSKVWNEVASQYWIDSADFCSSEEAKSIVENFSPTMENAIRDSIMNLLDLSENKYNSQINVHVTPNRDNYGSTIHNILITTNHKYLNPEVIDNIKDIVGNNPSSFATELFEVDDNIEYNSGRVITQKY